jgi:flagellar hook-associated protein 1 FlgK
MSLSLALDAALSGLMAAQRQTALASRNIANATTPGYTRKNAELVSLSIAGEGRGVSVANVTRYVDAALQRDARRESGLAQELSAKAAQLAALTTTIGQPDEERSISSRIAQFTSALQRLGESPESTVAQQGAVASARDVARSLNDLSARIKQLREEADTAIANSVSLINQTLDDIAKINHEIGLNQGTGRDQTDLLDQRDKLLDTLSKEMGIIYMSRGDGEILVLTEGGTTLVDGDAVHYLSFTHISQIAPSLSYAAGGLSGITVDGIDIAPGSGYAGSIRSGNLAAQFALRDQLLPQAQAQIDEIASTLADGFQRFDASVAPGQTGLFTDVGLPHDRSDPAQVVGLAGRIAVNPLVIPEQGGQIWRMRAGVQAAAPNAPGDATQIRAFQAVFEETVAFDPAAGLASSATIATYATEFVGFQGSQRAAVEERAGFQTAVADAIGTQRLNLEGVNIDDEMQHLLQLEQSYAASAKVMQAVREMMDRLLEI